MDGVSGPLLVRRQGQYEKCDPDQNDAADDPVVEAKPSRTERSVPSTIHHVGRAEKRVAWTSTEYPDASNHSVTPSIRLAR